MKVATEPMRVSEVTQVPGRGVREACRPAGPLSPDPILSPTHSLLPKMAPSPSTAVSTLSPQLCRPATLLAPHLLPLP